jgi:glycogen synthase
VHVLHISWEYPPLVYGGLGRHVHAVAEAQAAAGHDVTVLTQQGPGARPAEELNGVHVMRVKPPTPSVPREPDALVAWVNELDTRMARSAASLLAGLAPDVVHAHDWVVAQTATEVRRRIPAPLVVTVHATEAGRHQGWITADLSRRVNGIEYRLTTIAQRIIACSGAMKFEVSQLFQVDTEAIDVIPNGIDLGRWRVPENQQRSAIHRQAQVAPLIVFIGRLEWEKGVHTLLEAAQKLVNAGRDIQVVVAGTGTYEGALQSQASALIEAGVASFTGWLPEPQLRALAAAADVVVVPSLYEPFGLVALEAGALGAPVVVARTGGLADTVSDGVTGRVFEPGDAAGLAVVVAEVLDDHEQTQRMSKEFLAVLEEKFDWHKIAPRTVETYELAIAQAKVNPRPVDVAPLERVHRNLFTGEPAGD